MYNLVKKNNIKILVSLISVMILFLGLTFLVRKGNNSLTERQRKLMQYDQVQNGDEAIDDTEYVTFDAYFHENIGGTATKIRGEYLNINSSAELWLDLHVFGDVTLKDAKLEFSNSNVKTSGYLYKNSFIPKNMKVPNGGTVTLEPNIQGATLNTKITISSNITYDLKSLSSSNNKITLTGIVVKPNGEEVPITKEVKYTLDWTMDDLSVNIGSFNKKKQSFPYRQVLGCPNVTGAGNTTYAYYHEYTGGNYDLEFKLITTSNSPFTKSANIEIKIPDLNGYDPLSVSLSGENYNYDPTTQMLTASREAVLNGTMFEKHAYSYVNDGIYYNEWNIYISYPREVETTASTMLFDTTMWYEEYKYDDSSNIIVVRTDDKEEILTANYEKPIIRKETDLVCLEADRFSFGTNVAIGEISSALGTHYINKTQILKRYAGDPSASATTDYEIEWQTYLNYFDKFEEDTLTSMTINDKNSDNIQEDSLAGISRYKTIYIPNAAYWLGASGYIKIIDNNTNEVIHILTALDWNNSYTFTTNTSSIRLETSEVTNVDAMREHYHTWGWQDSNLLTLLNVNITKELDNDALINKYNLATFNNMSYISTTVAVSGTRHKTADNSNQTSDEVEKYSSAGLRTLQSANISVTADKTAFDSTESTDVVITISTGNYGDIIEGYKDAEFLVVLPDWVLDLDIESLTINNSDVNIDGYEKVDLGTKRAIKIITSNANPARYAISISGELIPDARQMDKSGDLEVYATNPSTEVSDNNAQDIYDVDNDADTDENQNYAWKTLTLTAPNEIITTTTINYKDANDYGIIVVSPMIADVNPVEDHSDAEVEIGITNNYTYPTQDIKVIGKIGFVGNTYQIGAGDLGSEFNVIMSNTGIKVPTELEGNVTIYYSDQEAPSDDLNNAANNWKTKNHITDFSTIKTYMIIIDDYTLPVGKRIAFTYDIEMPNTTANLNKKTFFTHGVYYNIVTNAGLLSTSVGGAKLGVRMSRRYDLELVNTKKGSTRLINGSKYIATAKDSNDNIIDQKILITDENGYAKSKNLYAGLEYEIKQVSVKYPYVLDEETKKLNVVNDSNDLLSLDITGTYKSANLTNDHLVNIELENEVRYDLILTNTDLDTDELIPYTKFKITGKGYESGYITMTNSEGKLSLKGLYLDEVYEIEQISVSNHLLTNNFNIVLSRDENDNVKIKVGKKASFETLVNIENGLNDYSYDSNIDYEIFSGSPDTHNKSYIPIDLEGLSDDYTLNFYTYFQVKTSRYNHSSSAYLKLYLLDNLDDITNNNLPTPFYDTNSSDSSSYRGHELNITGGKKYYLYIDEYYGTESIYTTYLYINNFRIYSDVNSDSDYFEYALVNSNTDVITYENNDVIQTLTDSDNQDSPVLNINVKNVHTPTYTLELTKVNADTKEPLANAQYRITGAGLPDSGIYLTTDQNGKFTIDLNKKMVVNGYTVDLINGVNYNQYDSEYTIEEVVAPIGYTLDDKSITFTGALNIHNYNWDWYNGYANYEVDFATETDNIISYGQTETRFKEAVWDGNTLKVTVYDYPIIKITKTDAETGNALPNTLFAIYSINRVGATEVLAPAINSKGDVVGEQLNIGGKDYYVVVTDENGDINLDLTAGQYKLIEVKASDEKYELNNAVYYFGIGETVPYQAPGLYLAGSYVTTFPVNDNMYSSKIIATSDNGWATLENAFRTTPWPYTSYLVKYDKDFNIEWKVDAQIKYYGTDYIYNYFDDTDRVEHGLYGLSTSTPYDILETNDGGFIIASVDRGIIVKFDKNGQREWQNDNSYYHQVTYYDKVCTYDGNTDENGNVIWYIDLYNYNTGEEELAIDREREWDSNIGGYIEGPIRYHNINTDDDSFGANIHAKRDDDTYYCHMSRTYEHHNTFSQGRSWLAETADGDTLLFFRNQYYNYDDYTHSYDDYYIELADGTLIPQGSYINMILRYDSDGNLVGAYDLDQIIVDAEQWYINKYNLTVEPKMIYKNQYGYRNNNLYFDYKSMYTYPNGDILIYTRPDGSYNDYAVFKIRYNPTTDSFDTIYYVPIGIDGFKAGYIQYASDWTYDSIKLTDDGGFTIANMGYGTSSIYLLGDKDPYYNTEAQQYGVTFDRESDIGIFLYAYDGEGKIKDFVRLITYYRDMDAVNNQGYSDLKYLYGGGLSSAFYIPLDDGSYIVGTEANTSYLYYYSDSSTELRGRFVQLSNGEIVTIDGDSPYILFKISSADGIEWLKEYNGLHGFNWYPGGNNYNLPSRISADGKRIVVPMGFYGNSAPVTEKGNDNVPYVGNNTSEANEQLIIFDLLDTISPSGPEAYTLNIENNRKEYKISSTANDGGEVVVTNPDNGQNVANAGVGTEVIERVKYGDTNKYDITIVPNANYVVASVKINNKDATYTVNADGSVTLNKIEDIKEDKNISIIYAQNKSNVIVKHYLKDTTTSIFGDELLTGVSGDPYETEPQQSDLYSLATDANGDIILPDNMTGNYADTPTTVIYYYQENEVALKVNYYLDGTDTELAPSNIERMILGSNYQVAPMNIANYEYSRTIGNSSGTLNNNTEVSFMYTESTESTITIRHVDKATGNDLVTPITKTVQRHDQYTTDDPVSIPAKYRQVGTPTNATGTAEDANIEVIYYYEEIPFNVSVDKKINSILLNGEKQTITNSKNVTITPAKKDNLIVYYEINLKNTGDIKANFTVVEGDIPGFVIYDKGNFVKTNNGYELTAELEPGEEKTYRIGYKWNQKDYGISTNKVELKEVTNDKGFAEPDALDNISTATIETKLPKEVLGSGVEIVPNTVDRIPTMIILLIASIIGIITSLILIRRKRLN